MFTSESILEVLNSTPREADEVGNLAHFVRINEDWGIKFYTCESMRNKTYDFQYKAWRNGLAPEICNCFELKIPGGDIYGYITECVVDTFADREAKALGYKNYDEIEYSRACDHREACVKIACRWWGSADQTHFETELYKIGLIDTDMHTSNIGYLAKGKLVIIDFSHMEEI